MTIGTLDLRLHPVKSPRQKGARRREEIYQLIERDINVIQKDLANYERVRRFVLLDHQFTVEEGELTPTQKVRRSVVEKRYADVIESMYEGVT